MAILFQHNFDGESEGDSPPANITPDTIYPPRECEVDDVQFNSTPHSMWLQTSGSGSWARREWSAGFTTERYSLWAYIPDTNGTRSIVTNKATGDHVGTNILVHLLLQTDYDIEYYDGAYQDTGYNWSEDTWEHYEIVHDCPNDQFDLWFNDTKIVSAGGFRNTGSSVKSIHWQFLTNNTEWWIDDVQVGTAGWEGKYLGVTNPTEINGVANESVEKVNGVVSS
jgi:hypothetical protein